MYLKIVIQTHYIRFQDINLQPYFKKACVKSVLWPVLNSNVVDVSLSGGSLGYWTACNNFTQNIHTLAHSFTTTLVLSLFSGECVPQSQHIHIWHCGGVTKPILSLFPIIQNDQSTGYLDDFTFIFDMCHRSWAEQTTPYTHGYIVLC